MGDFAQALFWAAAAAVPAALLMKKGGGKKGGCGESCASCGSREACRRVRETENKPKEQEKRDD